MLTLNRESLSQKSLWRDAGVRLPAFDVDGMRKNTRERPEWVHFGAGNIFRAFMAASHQRLLDQGLCASGIIAVETYDAEVVDVFYKPFDNLFLDVSISGEGALDITLVASIAEALVGDAKAEADWARLLEVFANPTLKMASFTVTEKGYAVTSAAGELAGIVQKDLSEKLQQPSHLISKLLVLLLHRYRAGQLPVALLSLDNCSQNGEKLRQGVLAVAGAALDAGLVPADFLVWLKDSGKVTYPWSMIDKITPRPSDDIAKMLTERGIEGMRSLVTAKNTYMAPFVNAESTQYLFIEDSFPNGRPPLDKSRGIWLTDRDTVNAVETMKVTTCLNPLHTALSLFGRLLGHDRVMDAIADPDIRALVERIGYQEGLPVVKDPGVIRPADFIDEVLNARFPNPYIPDTTARICSDTSMKVGIRFGETIKAHMEREDLSASSLVGIPLAIAAWIRYLMGVDDAGMALEISPDPRLPMLKTHVEGLVMGGAPHSVADLLGNCDIFGLDLNEAGLGERVDAYVARMIQGPGAVRKTLHQVLGDLAG